MIRPARAFIMVGKACWIQRCAPVRFVRITASQSSAFMRMARPSRVIAALFTRISRRPNFSTTCLNPAFTCSASETSIFTANASPPFATISFTSAASFSSLRAATPTFAPAPDSASAVSRPIPCDAPVTTATLSFKLNIAIPPGFSCSDSSFFPFSSLLPLHAASDRAPAIFSTVAARLFSSSTFSAATERSIWRSNPVSTRPGPTSTNVFTPSSINSRTDSSQRTGIETWRISASRASLPLVVVSASTFVTSGSCKFENSVLRKSFSSLCCMGIISAEWKGADTARMTARFAPACEASSTARFTAPACPEITVWSGEFRFAAAQISLAAARLHTSATTAGDKPIIAAIAPTPAGTASCMYVPRFRTSCTASANFSAPAATSAEYSPRLCPATKSGVSPFSSSTRYTATEQVKIAGCVFAVSLRSSSVPSKHNFEIEKPSALSASSKTAFAAGYFPARSLPIPEYCEACPGNTNATLPMANSSLAPSRENRGGGELLFDFLVHARAGETRRHTDGVFHCVRIRTPVPDHANAADAQKRRAAVLRVINRLLQALERTLGKHGTDLRNQRTLQRPAQQPENLQRQAFTNLQRDISYKSVANNDVHVAGKKIAAFDVPHEMYRAFFQPRVHLARQLVAFDLFFAYREQSDARPLASERRAVINLPHDGELHQVFRPRIHVGAHVQKHGDAAFGVRKRRRQRHAIHRLQRPKQKLRDGHHRTGIACADQPVGLRLAHQPRRDVHGTILLPPKRLRRVILHGDHVARRHDFNRQVWRRVLRQLHADHVLLAYQQNTYAELPCGQHTPFDLRTGRVVSAHGVTAMVIMGFA